MEKSMFFNSVGGDRRYKAEEFADYFNKFIGNGVFPNPSTNCQVLSNNDMTIRISPGSAWINGYMYVNTGDMNHVIEPANSVLNRIDRVVLRWDKVGREIYSYIKVGEYSSSPQPKPLQRDVDAYELCLADIRVNAGVTTIAQSDIRDTRHIDSLCGVVATLIEDIDTTTLYNQYEQGLRDRIEELDRLIGSENPTGELMALINTKMDKNIADKGTNPNFQGLVYNIVVIDGRPYLEVVSDG